MNNLVPERRPDKNGVVSTKWVRPAGGGASMAAVPAPVALSAVRKDRGSLFGSPIEAVFMDSRMDSPEFSLSQFDYDAVRVVNGLLERGVDLGREPMRVFNQAYYRLTDADAPGDPFLPMNDLAVFGEIVKSPDALANDLEPIIRGLAPYFGSERDYLNGVTEEERCSAIALVTVITRLENEEFIEVDDPYDEGPGGDYRSFDLRSPELAELVMANPDDAEEIIRIVNERESDDAAMVAEVLKSEHKSLSSGML
jgi:hypothetical protein